MLQVKGLRTRRRGGEVGPLEFEVSSGEVFAILGPSGSGKTTVLRMIVRLEDAEGEVRLDGEDLWCLQPHILRRKVALVPQEPVVFSGTVFENISYGRLLQGRNLRQEEAVELLSVCGLSEDFLKKPAAKLSTGEKMRVCIARALANGPVVLMLDEPTAALDPSIGAKVLRAVFAYMRQRSGAVVLVTHRVQDALSFGERALIIRDGRQIAIGEIPAILHTPEADFLKRAHD